MSGMELKEVAVYIRDNLRLKTFPVAVGFLKDKAELPEKARRPTVALGKRITICQGVTMARNYGWTMGFSKEDNICVAAAIMFGFSASSDQTGSAARLFCHMGFSSGEDLARKETSSMGRFQNGEIEAMVLAPMDKASYDPDVVLLYGNPAQMMRLAQAWTYTSGERISGQFGGKVECDEYLIVPFKTQTPRIVIPGNGERIFAAAQDDEMVLAVPGKYIHQIVRGLNEAGKAVGARYPATPYQNFQPDLPKPHKEMGKELGIL
ncbi:MAG TPA: DUF169 domain-containing protein [Syntrophobacteraceae bacterium]|nr:DUF169 domain-containing protein [Syntrophobacteraceae bacterium]